jgi:hypothetical protein
LVATAQILLIFSALFHFQGVIAMADASPEDARRHWARLCEGLQASPLEFYKEVEVAVGSRSVPDAVIERVEYREGGALSGVRQYLRIRRRREVFDVCGAPFGNGFFFSWWFAELKPSLPSIVSVLIVFVYLSIIGGLMEKVGVFAGATLVVLLVPLILFFMSRMGNTDADDFVLLLPIIGWVYERLFHPITYYRLDTSEMFQQAVQNAVMDVVNRVVEGGGLRALTELEQKPVMRDFWKK